LSESENNILFGLVL